MIDKKTKKIFVFEIIAIILVIILIVANIFILLNPRLKQVQTRDQQREEEIQSILQALESYIAEDEGALEYLEQIELCVNGWTEIGQGEDRIDLKSTLAEYTNQDFVDPVREPESDYSGYDICRSYDGMRFVIRSTDAELQEIELTKRVMLLNEDES